MICTFETIADIIVRNPNKAKIERGREMATKLRMHLQGVGMKDALKQCKHFEDDDIYKVRMEYANSNKDLFGRLLQQEDMIFTARGGSSTYGLSDDMETEMNALLDDVQYGLSLRQWIKVFGMKAYRADPMGVIFIEVEQLVIDSIGVMPEPKAYPTYKSVFCIHDYLPNGRKLEYVCFRLSVGEALGFGIVDEELKQTDLTKDSNFYRFVDDVKDLIVKRKGNDISLVTTMSQQNPIANEWNRTPAIVISDLLQYDDPMIFASPLELTIELADTFLNDRSVRDLQKKHHGFSKAVEPLLKCGTCDGSGFIGSDPCKDCSKPGDLKGSGYKIKTKPSDVARFPLKVFENASGFDFNKIFGYVTPDIKGWEKQDMSLDDLEELMEMTYWGTIRVKRPKPGTGNIDPGLFGITATEVDSNNQPKEARLNTTADWAEKTEMMIADFIGEYWYQGVFKKSSINYSRDYILKSTESYKAEYEELRSKGAPDSALDNAYKRWKEAEFRNNPVQLAIELKKFMVEPFPHIEIQKAKSLIPDFIEFCAKLYFGEWSNTIPTQAWYKKPEELRNLLKAYVAAKSLVDPATIVPPGGVPGAGGKPFPANAN